MGQVGLAIAGGMKIYDLPRVAARPPMATESIGKAARKLP